MKVLPFLLLCMGFGAVAQFYPPNLVIEDDTAYPSLDAIEAPEMFRFHEDPYKKAFLTEMSLSGKERSVEAVVFFDESVKFEEITGTVLAYSILKPGVIFSDRWSGMWLYAVIDGMERRDVVCKIWADTKVINRAAGYCGEFGIEIGFFEDSNLHRVRIGNSPATAFGENLP